MKTLHLLPSIALAALMPVTGFAQDAADAANGGLDIGAMLQDQITQQSANITVAVELTSDGRLMDESGAVPFKCPIEKVRQAYQELTDATDTLMAIAIEKQILGICAQSQEALIKIAENEQKLGDLFAEIVAPSEPLQAEPAPHVAMVDPVMGQAPTSMEPAIPAPSTGSDITLGDGMAMLEDMLEEDDAPIEDIAPIEPVKKITPPEYKVIAVMKDGDGMRALLRLNAGLYTVRQGDRPDETYKVTNIENGLVEMEDRDGNTFILE